MFFVTFYEVKYSLTVVIGSGELAIRLVLNGNKNISHKALLLTVMGFMYIINKIKPLILSKKYCH